jgi:nitrogenase molybdenum-cofactor synthesis protein NifE
MTHLAKRLEEMYGTPYRRVSFFGLEDMCLAVRYSAEFFGIQKTAEEIILRETARVRQEGCHLTWAGRPRPCPG